VRGLILLEAFSFLLINDPGKMVLLGATKAQIDSVFFSSIPQLEIKAIGHALLNTYGVAIH
jgi:hypothetical protein